jgi:cytochrome b561
MTDRPAYSRTRRVLHWVIGVLVIGMVPAGLYFTDFDNKPAIEAAFGAGSFDAFYNLHKAVGLTILALMIARIWAKRREPDPPHSPPLPDFNAQMSRFAHRAFYVLLVVGPLLGWAGVSAYPAPLPVFGLFEAPKILPPNRELAETLLFWHKFCGLCIGALAVAHIGAALHHRARKDGVFERMALRFK